jgi:hypothetical protein
MPIHGELDPALVSPTPAPRHARPETADVSRSIADPGGASHQAVFELQRLAGNVSVSGLLGPVAQRSLADGDEEAAGAERSPVLDVVGKGGGTPLDVGVRREMEGHLGADFSNVRLHTDATATESARAVDANAYTVGDDVVIRNDRYSPDSSEGRKTIAHELTHVVQQRSGPVAGSDAGGGIRLSDPSDEFEQAAERSATAIMSGASAPPTPAAGPGAAQLEAEDEAAVQGQFVQREGVIGEEGELEEEEEEKAAQGEFVQREGETEEELEEEEKGPTTQGEFVQREGEEESDEVPTTARA